MGKVSSLSSSRKRRKKAPRWPRRRTKSSPPTTTPRAGAAPVDEELNALFGDVDEAADKAMGAIVEKFIDVD